jgi:hypothetical protein
MENVLPFPVKRMKPAQLTKPAHLTKKQLEVAWQAHAEKVRQKTAELKAIPRVGKNDGLIIACNLGEIIETSALDHQLDVYDALKLVWQRFDPGHERWAKRLRYIRFSDERRTTDVARSGADFLALGSAIADALPVRTVTPEHNLLEVQTRLLRGTAFDADPAGTASIDFDAVRELGVLIDATIAKIVAAVPQLTEYFRRIELHGLTHPEADEPFVYDPTLRPMQPFDYFHWLTDQFETPSGQDVSWNLTVSPATMHEGFAFEDGAGLEAMLPRLVLGRITYATRTGSISEEALAQRIGGSAPLHPDIVIRAITEDPTLLDILLADPADLPLGDTDLRLQTFEVQFVLVPTADPRSHGVRAGIIVRRPIESFYCQEDERLDGIDEAYEGLRVLRDRNGARRFVLDRYSLQFADKTLPLPLPAGMFFDSLFLIPGGAAEHVLGLRHSAPIHELAQQPVPLGVSVIPNFDAPPNFTPQAATSLGGLLARNLLYTEGPANIINRLIDDARARAARLDVQYQGWLAEYASARRAFLNADKAEQ